MGEIVPYKKHRDKITAAVEFMQALPQLGMREEHSFCPGVYARTLHMPAGAHIISKIHKTEHFVVCVKGSAWVLYPDRKELVKAPLLMVTKPGTQRALKIITDSVWIGFYPTEQTDVAKIEANIIAEDFNDPELLEYFEGQALLTDEG